MKQLLYLLLLSVTFLSCERYEEPTYPTLSGNYVIDVITISTDSYTEVLYPGDTLFLNDTNFPMDTIAVGFTKLGFNNTHMGFNIVENQWGDYYFEDKFPYTCTNFEYQGDGFFWVIINGIQYSFDILQDGLEDLIIRSKTGRFRDSNNNEMELTFTMTMTY